jgi:hypothetical protein
MVTTAPVLPTGLPVHKDICFTDHEGIHKPRIEKQQQKLLDKAAPLLKRVLEPGEEVRYITAAISPYSVLEFFTTGKMIVYVKRCLLVVTDRRLFHLPTTPSLKPKASVSQVRYADVKSFQIKSFLGTKLVVEYRNGTKESFTSLPRRAAKKLKDMLPQCAGQGEPMSPGARHHICPRCSHPLGAEPSICKQCRLTFKEHKRGMLNSILFPGGGYFYTRHPVMGLGDAVVELVLIGLVIGSILGAPQGDPEGWTSAIIFAIILAFEKAITVYHTKHYLNEFLPTDPKLISD